METNFWGFAAITVVMILTTMVAFVLQKWNLPESNIIMVYILGVLLSSYISDNKLFAVYSSMFSVLAFNFFFTEPYLSLKAYDKGYPTTFLMLFIVGLFTAVQTRKLKLQNRESVKRRTVQRFCWKTVRSFDVVNQSWKCGTKWQDRLENC